MAASCIFGFGPMAFSDVTGKVTLEGQAPEAKEIDMKGVAECAKLHANPVFEETVWVGEKGELANVVVSVKADEAAALGGEVPKEPALLDQKGCQYVPHVLAMMVGQQLKVKNSDPFLHNVHSLAQTNPAFNFGQATKDDGKPVDPPKAPENIKLKCDVHPWMSAWIIVLDHPFFGVSKEDGTFAVKGLPDGEYTLQAWHEKYGTKEEKVTVKDGKSDKPVEFKFQAGSAQAEPNGADTAQLASAKTSDTAIVADSATCAACPTMPCCVPAGGTPDKASPAQTAKAQ
jgi:hypothetical protein